MGYLREVEIDAPLDRVWQAFSSASELQHWLCERANVVLQPGGAFECYWGPNSSRSTEGCRIVALEPQRHLAFQFRGVGDFADVFQPPTSPTIIDVRFRSDAPNHTTIVLEQSDTRPDVEGWAAYDEWAADAWEDALQGLKQRCEEGGTSPIAREAFLH